MTVEPARPVESAKAGTPRKRRGALYLFCVVAVAVFLIFLTMGRGQNGRFKATAVLLATTTQPAQPLPSLDTVREQLTSPSLIRETVDQLVSSGAVADAQLTSAEVRYDLDVQQHTESTAERIGVAVSYTGRDPESTISIVNRICDDFVRQQSSGQASGEAPAYRDDYADAERRAQEAERDFQEAKRRLIDFDGQHGNALNPQRSQEPADDSTGASEDSDAAQSPDAAHDSDSSQAAAPPQPRSSADLADAEREVAALESRLEQKTDKLAELLKTLAPSHPNVTAANLELARLETELAAARIKVDVRREFEQGFDDQPQPANLAADSLTDPEFVEPPIDASERESLLAERRFLEDAVREAERKHELAKQAEHQQWELRFNARPTLVWYVEPATTSERNYVPTEGSLLLIATLLGLLSGGGFLIASSNPATINSESSAEAVLSTPVVGTVPQTAGHAPRASQMSWVLRLIVLGAESALFVFLLAMVVAALLDKQFADQLLADPLSALADGVGHLLGMLRR